MKHTSFVFSFLMFAVGGCNTLLGIRDQTEQTGGKKSEPAGSMSSVLSDAHAFEMDRSDATAPGSTDHFTDGGDAAARDLDSGDATADAAAEDSAPPGPDVQFDALHDRIPVRP